MIRSMGVNFPPKSTRFPWKSGAPTPVTRLQSLLNEPDKFSGN